MVYSLWCWGWCSFYVMANAPSLFLRNTSGLCARWRRMRTLRNPDFFMMHCSRCLINSFTNCSKRARL
jgi:hypothetical protein